MKFCSNCGKQIEDNAIFCPHCGARANGDTSGNPYGGTGTYGGYNPYGGTYPVYDTTPSKAVAVLSFFFWQVGVILWLVFRRTRPGKATSALKGALASACVSMPVLGLVLWLIWKNDPTKQSFAKVAGYAAIAGACLIGAWTVLQVLATMLGVGGEITFPYGGMLAYIGTLIG